MNCRIHAVTDCGMRRTRNEDAFFVTGFPDGVAMRALLVVADGMGGHAAGDVAARIIAETFEAAVADFAAAAPDESALEQVLQQAAARANQAILQHVQQNPHTHGMGATLVAAALPESGRAVLAWMGDSRAYLLRDSRPRLLTSDHSVVNDLVARGVITPQAARHHPDRHLITRALGIGPPRPCDIVRATLRPGDILFLCSDGLTSVVSDGSMALAATMCDNPEALCVALVAEANHRGGPDNITVAAAFCDE